MVDKDPACSASQNLKEEILRLKKEKDAVILAHYYQNGEIQDIADFIGDSLALAQVAQKLENKVIVMCGVNFMGETAKILCPDKVVLLPDASAGCSLADSCDAVEFAKFLKDYPGYTVVSYVNTTARVKALSDILVTSGNAKKIIDSLPQDEKIVFGPDRNLGTYINNITGRKMVLWDGACHVHEKFSADNVKELKAKHPAAKVLVHPECKEALHDIADKVGSTAALLKYVGESGFDQFIVVTECGILHELKKKHPGKTFIAAESIEGGCNKCEHMKLCTLEKLRDCLRDMSPRVEIDSKLMDEARKSIERMLALS